MKTRIMVKARFTPAKKAFLTFLSVLLFAVLLTGCGTGKKKTELKYHFADREEAQSCFLSNEDYFNGFSPADLQYKTQDKNGTLEEYKEFGAAQMEEFSDAEKEVLQKTLEEMQADLDSSGITLPDMEEFTLIKSTQEEECGSGAYTQGTQIYMGEDLVEMLGSDDEEERLFAKSVLWHEIFHCLTRNNPEFRKDMYKIIHFTVQDKEYAIPPSVFKIFISNPDVEHHNAYATFRINGKDVDCFTALIATKPFEKKGDSFFDCMDTALVPVDGSDTYYLPDDAENFWEVFGENTDYVIDQEESMADNFSYALTYGMDGMDYKNPEIIKAILEYLGASK